MSETEVSRSFSISYNREKFPLEYGPDSGLWKELFKAHGQEARGRDMKLNWSRYYQIEHEGRLIWIVARDENTLLPIGYSCHWSYVDMHFSDHVGADDLWYVIPAARGLGVGTRLKTTGLDALRAAGAIRTYDMIRAGSSAYNALDSLGYKMWGHRFVKEL